MRYFSILMVLTVSFAGSLAPPAAAQLFDATTILKNAFILNDTDSEPMQGDIVIRGTKFVSVGPKAKTGLLSRSIDLTGKTVTPGFIDSWSALGHTGASTKTNPTANAWDAFDTYNRAMFREALRHGVTTVYLSPGAGVGINGMGAVVQIVPGLGGRAGVVLEKEASLSINLGSGLSPVRRAKRYAALRKQFQTAIEYRKSLEDYEEDLEEYLEKLEERRKENEKEDGSDKKKSKEKKAEKNDSQQEEAKDEEKPEDGKDHHNWTAPFQQGDKPNGEKGKNGKKSDNGKEDDSKDKKDELKKPKKPKRDPTSAIILRAMEREFPVRMQAHLSADIENALELASSYHLDLIVEGATEAYLLADRLAEADVSVILGPVARSALYEPNEYRRHTERNAERLTQAGVLWTMGSGAVTPLDARFVAYQAQLASAYGARNWLSTVTSVAAEVLGLDQTIGQLASGMQADMVVWSGDPTDPASVVERVYVAGKLAYLAPHLKKQGEGR